MHVCVSTVQEYAHIDPTLNYRQVSEVCEHKAVLLLLLVS